MTILMTKMLRIAGLVAVLVLLLVPEARSAPSVDVTIEVLEASRTTKGFDRSARRYQEQLSQMGFVGAKTIDTLTAKNRTEGSSVELRFEDGERKKRAIRVKVLASDRKKTRLRIEVPSLSFATTTTHKDGGTFIALMSKTGLVLAVRPTH